MGSGVGVVKLDPASPTYVSDVYAPYLGTDFDPDALVNAAGFHGFDVCRLEDTHDDCPCPYACLEAGECCMGLGQ
jgi:hypothetical protein